SEACLFPLRTLELQFKLLFKIAPCAKTGKIIGKGKSQKAFIGLLARKQIVGYQRQRPQQLCISWFERIDVMAEELHRAQHPSPDKQWNHQRSMSICSGKLRVGDRIQALPDDQRFGELSCP